MELWNQVFPYINIKHLVVPHLTPRFLQLLEGHDAVDVTCIDALHPLSRAVPRPLPLAVPRP